MVNLLAFICQHVLWVRYRKMYPQSACSVCLQDTLPSPAERSAVVLICFLSKNACKPSSSWSNSVPTRLRKGKRKKRDFWGPLLKLLYLQLNSCIQPVLLTAQSQLQWMYLISSLISLQQQIATCDTSSNFGSSFNTHWNLNICWLCSQALAHCNKGWRKEMQSLEIENLNMITAGWKLVLSQ